MNRLAEAILVFGPVALPFIAMPLLWRRMKRVRDGAYSNSEPSRVEPHWQETIETRIGVTAARDHQPNEELIELGDRAQHSHWPISNP